MQKTSLFMNLTIRTAYLAVEDSDTRCGAWSIEIVVRQSPTEVQPCSFYLAEHHAPFFLYEERARVRSAVHV